MTLDDRQKSKITVGDFTVSRYDETAVWVQRDLGDRGFQGACIPDAHFAELLEKIWKENF